MSIWPNLRKRRTKRRRRLLQQVIPTEDIDEVLNLPPDKRSSKYIGRPGFSIPLMTNKFDASTHAPPRTIKPAPEMSKDFLRNMRDLQNSMDDFSKLHDAVLKVITPPTNFSNEALSSTVFILSLLCWTSIALGHPSVQQFILENRESHLRPHERKAQSMLDSWIARDIILDAPPETREVKVFQL
ncbi:MAG: hypothetical protein L6R38_000535 [Xanthoria sp. 2 TBL-2021]|nr:MAG: hypothetical protein L6R38_000535 [Xanthoria sp. 2 TBL-2021]